MCEKQKRNYRRYNGSPGVIQKTPSSPVIVESFLKSCRPRAGFATRCHPWTETYFCHPLPPVTGDSLDDTAQALCDSLRGFLFHLGAAVDVAERRLIVGVTGSCHDVICRQMSSTEHREPRMP